jgi:AbrB family looped-hinge helix DNA binding protein
MEKIRLLSKGRVTLPKSVRKERNWKPGTEFWVELVKDGVLLRPVRSFKTTTAKELLACAGYRGPSRSLTEMQAAIALGFKDRSH